MGTKHSLLGVEESVDPQEYRRRYDEVDRTEGGLPTVHALRAAEVGKHIAETYERYYDEAKAQLQAHGSSFSEMARADDGSVTNVNHASVVGCYKVWIETEGPLMPYFIMGLHWMLTSKDHVWVFEHLAHATNSYFCIKAVREHMPEDAEGRFDEMRDFLREALYHYDHRAV